MSAVDTTLIDRPAAGPHELVAPAPVASPAPAVRPIPVALPVAALVAVLTVGIAVRFVDGGPLWFDETQSVAIARLPLGALFEALRQDGSPPLYYLLLHGWMLLFGTGTGAVRALSGLCSVAALPAVWLLARRLLPRRAAIAALVLVATSPMAIRYALEVRMYALEPLLIALGGLGLLNVLERPSTARVAALALATGALSLTHYWALFLIAAVGLGLAPGAVRRRPGRLPALCGILAGAVFFLPWLPSMLFQVQHTGTPWSHAAIYEILQALPAWGGADEVTEGLIRPSAAVLVPLLMGLVAIALTRVPTSHRILGVAAGTLLLAGVASVGLHSAVVPRYLTVGLLPYLFVAAAGLATLRAPWRNAVLGTAALLGVVTGVVYGMAPRTIAGDVASTLRRHGHPRDLVVYCPDQLGPDVSRLLPGWSEQRLYPTGGPPGRVDWIDYSARNLGSHPARYAREVVAAAPRRRVWLFEARGFAEYHGRCGQLASQLARLRPVNRVRLTGRNPMDPTQRESLTEFLPTRS